MEKIPIFAPLIIKYGKVFSKDPKTGRDGYPVHHYSEARP